MFGSVLTKNFSHNSDIDFLVKIDSKVGFEKYADSYYTLKEQLKNIFKREIDLITEQSIKNPYLKKELEETKQLVYEK
ncbi:nucleotidyltransferase domain-containing protein [Flammeovirga yaeyamensis]|uniref:Nucleotidyltransferase domain-containing protein n=1 Tax=Flammeovirga yaeyamensis TaxID=367791 RepID=A0AAX1N073_9BACT|nr:hypothetical protein [Flammeovirga yaeyamensis]QWG00737.1 nucleotidyltransferase domain-containing protein [Flammeovirga yaeyamensis]